MRIKTWVPCWAHKKYAEAIKIWQEGLLYDPQNKAMMQYISDAYRYMGNEAEAKIWEARAKSLPVK